MRWLETPPSWRTRAAALFADPQWELEGRARVAARGGFSGGAEWMRHALAAARNGAAPRGNARFARLGRMKYAACSGAALAAGIAVWWTSEAAALGVVAAFLMFYAVEAQSVFLFPVALDGAAQPWRKARELVRREGGTLRAMSTVLPIAWRMVTGSWRGWSRGCLEVVLWYEEARGRATNETRPPALVLGDGGSLLVRRETVAVPGLLRAARIAWVSDLHLGRRSAWRTERAVVAAVRRIAPDAIVLGGDLVDSERALPQLARLVRSLTREASVWALPGNHDEPVGLASVAAAVRGAGGGWLPGVAAPIAGGALTLVTGSFDWRRAHRSGAVVACVHEPAAASAWDGYAHVALAGHLHGGQIVLAERFGRLWPCALLYRWSGLRFTLPRGMTLIVGRGVGDTLPIRWRCPREVVCVDLVPEAAAEVARAA